MIIPSIDLMDGRAVQLVGGREKVLDAGDPRPIAERFARVGEVAVVDLDAALGQGDNSAIIRDLLQRAPCRVGGGIRDVDSAKAWLDAGARSVVLGTAAVPQVLEQLPRERVVAALDAQDGEVVVNGWRTRTGASVVKRMSQLREYVGGFLVTQVEREGRMQGIDELSARRFAESAGNAKLTFAGGVTTPEDVAALDALGADAQVGMALYTERLGLAESFCAPLRSDRADGLWPTIVCSESGEALGLVYSSAESVAVALAEGRGVYHSRRRGLWRKGESSGDEQELLRIEVDCDRDALRFVVRQRGAGFCHLGTPSCFGQTSGLPALARRLRARRDDAPRESYTSRLLADPQLLGAKLVEEAGELAEASARSEVVHEAADLLFFALTAMARADVSLPEVERELDRRALKLKRRPGDAKPGALGLGSAS